MAVGIGDLRLLDPSEGTFADVDFGNVSQGLILLNILMELRVHTEYLAAMNTGIVKDDPDKIRLDVTNNPASLYPSPTGQT